MENPVKEISGVIHLLTQSPPSVQRETIDTYFTPDATFTHPFCRTGKWDNSRFLIQVIYRWYKIMSPRIEMNVNSVAFDEPNSILYVHFSQVFSIWLFPFHRAPVSCTTVIHLRRNRADEKYYIDSQNDLYQVDEFVKFVLPFGWIFVWAWQFWSTLFCLLGAVALTPVTWLEERGWGWKGEGYGAVGGGGGRSGAGGARAGKGRSKQKKMRGIGVVEDDGIELRDWERKKAKVVKLVDT